MPHGFEEIINVYLFSGIILLGSVVAIINIISPAQT